MVKIISESLAEKISPKPFGISEDVWKGLLDKLMEMLKNEVVGFDVCLIGSYARGDASPLSDIDLVMFTDGESNLKRTELFYVKNKMVTVFPVNIERLLKAGKIDFYSVNNPFEAKLIYGEGKILDRLKRGLRGRKVDLDATKRLVGETLSNRLMAALSDVVSDYGEGIRDLRVCLAKLELLVKLLEDEVDPWLILPYRYKPRGEVENLLDKLYYSKSYEELSEKLEKIDPTKIMKKAFGENFEKVANVAERIVEEVGFAGKYVTSYVCLYLVVEEIVRSKLWRKLPSRWEIDKPGIDHCHTNIACLSRKVWWHVATEGDGHLKLQTYGATSF